MVGRECACARSSMAVVAVARLLSPLCVRLVLGGGGLLSAGPDGVVKLWALRGEQLEGAEEVIAMSHGANCRGLAASADGRLVASGGGRAVVVWRPA